MKRRISLLSFAFALCFSGYAVSQNVGCGLRTFINSQSDNKTRVPENLFPERFSVSTIDNEAYVSLLGKLKSGVEDSDLHIEGCKFGSRSGRIVCLKVKTDCVERVIESGLFEKIDVARKTDRLESDKAVVDVNADYVWQGAEGLPEGYDGSGVIIGIADWGFDYTHPVFYDTLMNEYRVIAAWDQYRSGFTPPDGFDYGAYISGKENLLAAQSDTNNIYDIGYHGTHVGGIAAGGGAGTKYKGVAYGANLLFATWLIDETNVLDAYTWMRNEAKQRGKRLVVNNSWGIYHFGEMDGSSMFDEFVENMANEDSVIFVASAGNNGNSSFHIKCDFNNADTLRSKFEFDYPQSSSEHYWGQSINMLGDSTDAFSARVEIYSKRGELIYKTDDFNTANPTTASGVHVYNEADSVIFRVGCVSGSASSRPQMEWEIRLSNPYSNCNAILIVSSERGYVHAWNLASLTTGVGNWGLPFVWQQAGFVRGDDEYSIGEPAIGKGMIAVAAYVSGRRNGSSNSGLASFSSGGPNLCEYLKPEVSAPGVGVVNALSSFTTSQVTGSTFVEFDSKTYGFTALSGTSMSSPVVSGIAALMLQANNTLTASQVKEILTSTSRQDMFTGEVPNFQWGYGKVDALAATKKAIQMVGLESIEAESNITIAPNPAKGVLHIYNIPNDCTYIGVCDIYGKELMRSNGGKGSIDVGNLPSGVYFLRLHCQSNTLNFKFMKCQ